MFLEELVRSHGFLGKHDIRSVLSLGVLLRLEGVGTIIIFESAFFVELFHLPLVSLLVELSQFLVWPLLHVVDEVPVVGDEFGG